LIVENEGRERALPLVFRLAEARDVGAIVALVTSAYRGDASRVGWTTEADLLDGQRTDDESVLALMAHPEDGGVVLAESGGDLLACCHIERVGAGEGYFGMFSVQPDQQGGGVGRRVLEEAERLLATVFDCVTCSMTVIDVRDELIAWYERRGYARTGVYKPFPYGDERFGIPKHPGLRFEVLKKTLRR
jgi:GNAT superfamily N-acetyltransferase